MKIWTFWEPPEEMPVYIQLCMKTWEKFLPKAEVILVNQKNLSKYIDLGNLEEKLFSGPFTLPLISDVVRAFLLAEYGGIWLDADTIFLNDSVRKYFTDADTHHVTFFGVSSPPAVHIAFINTNVDDNSETPRFVRYWRECVRHRLEYLALPQQRMWGYFGNDCVDPYIKAFPEEIKILDRTEVMPELNFLPPNFISEQHLKCYQDFYILQDRQLKDINCDMLMLHNSWTPRIFKLMNYDELLHVSCTLTNILFEVLEIDRSHIGNFIVFNLG